MNKKMPAVVNYAPEPNSVEIREVPIPEIGEQDVLLAVQAVGVCGTDIHLAYGQHSGKINYPVILGHEFGGESLKSARTFAVLRKAIELSAKPRPSSTKTPLLFTAACITWILAGVGLGSALTAR